MPIAPTNPIANQIGQTILGQRLDKLLGSGSYGAVYLAFSHGTASAVKLSSNERSTNNEVKILQSLHGCEGIPKLMDFGFSGDFHVIVFELGFQSLHQLRLKNAGFVFKPETVQKILHQATSILEKIHGLGVHHQDLKDDNFLVSIPINPNNKVTLMVTDFGLSRQEHSGFDQEENCIGLRGHDSPNTMRNRIHSAIDDFIQLSYSAIYMLTNRHHYCADEFEDTLALKIALLHNPSLHLPHQIQWLRAFFEAIGQNGDDKSVDYTKIKEAIQTSIPDSDGSSSLHLNYYNYQYFLL